MDGCGERKNRNNTTHSFGFFSFYWEHPEEKITHESVVEI